FFYVSYSLFLLTESPPSEIYTLSLHDALPIFPDQGVAFGAYFGAWLYGGAVLAIAMIWSAVTEDQLVAAFLGAATILVLYLAELDRKSTRLNSSHVKISYAVFCLKKKKSRKF